MEILPSTFFLGFFILATLKQSNLEMPPFVARKRRLSTPSSELPTPKRSKKPIASQTFESSPVPSVHDKKKFLDSLVSSESESSLSDASSDDFEDVLPAKKQKLNHDELEEDEVDWENALGSGVSAPITPGPELTGNFELTLNGGDDSTYALDNDKKKGPSKIEKKIRVVTHCAHVQFLMFHNAIRNSWISDKEVQKTLVEGLPQKVKEEVEKWRVACGDKLVTKESPRKKKGKGRQTNGRTVKEVRGQRDWGPPAERLEAGVPDLSHGDPTVKLLGRLAACWRKNFTIIAPGLRKQGYKSVRILEEEISSFHKEKHNHEDHGERIATIKEFRAAARLREGSRDVAAQLFTSLLRGLGIDARLVASLQPVGFGWSKAEDAPPKKMKVEEFADDPNSNEPARKDSNEDASPHIKTASRKASVEGGTSHPSPRADRGGKDMPIDLSDTSDLSDVASEDIPSDTESIIDVTPVYRKKSNKRYDRDLAFPIYWTEAISPISHQVIPVDSMVLQTAVATTPEQLMAFEPRGAKAEKARQVIAYIIAHSSDGTAKDVTVRYLRKHVWPGKTKGYRMPVEKVPIYNMRGKIKRYEEYDWFKTVMSGYNRPSHLRTLTDDIEDEKDLQPVKTEKKPMKEGEETLQGYKQSAEFVLERHLRREEALLGSAEPVKTFKSGKGDKEKEEPVFLRKDVVVCKTEESWHKEGRQVKADAIALKYVPVRAVTLTRKREMEDMTRRNDGVKPTQGLFSKVQTEWIIPPPIKDGVIPKNKYGNMDCFVPSMVPKGVVHVPLRSTVRVCKKLGIDYAEAVTGFEFGNKMAVPICQGVIVAVENEDALIDAWKQEEELRQMKEDEKRAKLILGTWRKFLMGLRIVEKVRGEYGEDLGGDEKDSVNPFTNQRKSRQSDVSQAQRVTDAPEEASDNEGGFVRDDEDEVVAFGGGFEVVDPSKDPTNGNLSSGFLPNTVDSMNGITVDTFADKHKSNRQRRTTKAKSKNAAHKSTSDISHNGLLDTDDESSLLSALDLASDSSDGVSDFDIPKKALVKTNAATPLRQSHRLQAGGSTTQTRSHYFEQESTSGGDEDDDIDQKPKARKKRGRPSGTAGDKAALGGKEQKGTNRRGRGRPRKTI